MIATTQTITPIDIPALAAADKPVSALGSSEVVDVAVGPGIAIAGVDATSAFKGTVSLLLSQTNRE
jgi:hypothetical protein